MCSHPTVNCSRFSPSKGHSRSDNSTHQVTRHTDKMVSRRELLNHLAAIAALAAVPVVQANRPDWVCKSLPAHDYNTKYEAHVYNIACLEHDDVATFAGAFGDSFFRAAGDRDRAQGNAAHLNNEQAKANYGCDAYGTELGPQLRDGTIKIEDVRFYQGLSGDRGWRRSPFDNAITSNVFLWTGAASNGDKRMMGFCNYWPLIHQGDSKWTCDCSTSVDDDPSLQP